MLEGLFGLSSVLQLDSVTYIRFFSFIRNERMIYILVVMPRLIHAGSGVGWREAHLVWS
jgi:hypothetical protein